MRHYQRKFSATDHTNFFSTLFALFFAIVFCLILLRTIITIDKPTHIRTIHTNFFNIRTGTVFTNRMATIVLFDPRTFVDCPANTTNIITKNTKQCIAL